MIELIQVHDLGSAMEDGRTTINIPITANILTKNTVALRRNFAGVKQRRRDIVAVCNGGTMKVNVTFGNPDSELKNRKITFQEYAERKAMKTNYNNRMVTDYEKENIEKPKFPENTVIRESSFPGEKPSAIRRIIARVKNICK